ncbi:MAG: signal peptidase I [Clostridiaceae bacterium]|nr:signal peptidase I [Clostridiaceae bacterium]
MKILLEILSWTAHIVLAIVLGMAINIFIIQPTQIQGCSMESTLFENDRVIINKLVHTFRFEPDYGNIVIIDSRVDRDRSVVDDITDSLKYNILSYKLFGNAEEIFWIKRVIGKAGDTLEFKDGKVVRNGEVLEESYIKEPMQFFPDGKITVPKGHIFVMGDNRNRSRDSREIGCVPIDHVMGKFIVKF